MENATNATAAFATQAQRWAAVVRRAGSADGAFCYAVRTTGVYCRPSCGARRALRKNVRFFDDAAAAERAGFRACKRCRPNGAGVAQQHALLVARACRLIDSAATMPDLASLAQTAGLSRFHFHRVFKRQLGMTPKAYISAQRAVRARDQLRRGGSVTDAIYEAGFGSNGRFYAGSAAALGMTPSSYRGGGDGVAIRFAIGACSLGSILVAATDKGICAILLGDDAATLLRDLEDRFPKARRRSPVWSRRRRWASTCRWICAAPPSSTASGRRCAASGRAARSATASSRAAWAFPARRARSQAR